MSLTTSVTQKFTQSRNCHNQANRKATLRNNEHIAQAKATLARLAKLNKPQLKEFAASAEKTAKPKGFAPQSQKKPKVTLISFNLKSGHPTDLVVCRKSNGEEKILYRHEIPIYIKSYNLWLKYRRRIPQLSTQEFFTISFHEIDGGEA